MDTKSELKSLIWDVIDSQKDLIKLGDDVLKQTGSLKSWIKRNLFGVILPFKSLADRAESLNTKFINLKSKLDLFKNNKFSKLSIEDSQAFGILCEFADSLALSALILKTNQAKYLSASLGKHSISLHEVLEGIKQYNESITRYLKVANRLQPHINRIFKENHT